MTRDEMERALGLLDRLVREEDDVAFTGQSLHVILATLRAQWSQTPSDKEGDLIAHWEKELPKYRKRLLKKAMKIQIPGDRNLMLVTENAAFAALCPSPPYLP